MTNRHWYDDSKWRGKGGCVQGNQAFLPVVIFYCYIHCYQSNYQWVFLFKFLSFVISGYGVVNGAALGPFCVKSLTAAHS